MAIISEIGRKHIKVRFLIWFISLYLIAGAITMVYPFLLMFSGTSKSSVDSNENAVIPSFLIDRKAMYRKSVEAIFNETAVFYQASYDVLDADFKHLEPPQEKDIKPAFVKEWLQFVREKNYKHYYFGLSFISAGYSRGTLPVNYRRFKKIITSRFDNDLAAMNRTLGLELPNWNSFGVHPGQFLARSVMPNDNSKLYQNYFAFKEKLFDSSQKTLPLVNRYFLNPEGYFKTSFLQPQYSAKISNYNKTHNTKYEGWNDVKLARTYPADRRKYTDLQRDDWETFTRLLLNRLWIKAKPRALPVFQTYLKARYCNKITELNKLYNSKYKSFSEVKMPTQLGKFPFSGKRFADWNSFIQGWIDTNGKNHMIPIMDLEITSATYDFRDHLKNKFKTLANANKILKTNFAAWDDIKSPEQAAHYLWIKKNSLALKWEFLKRNFISVFDYVAVHGYAIWNTLLYCSLAVLCALIVNPLAAYALSRFNLPSTYKILLFLMLTMAFPPMVTQIPVFLLLREFNILNTYAALILPGLANGYSIFLLKGFFDSLPRELYESAQIDGASECRIFLQITMSLSKPILAVIALQTFVGAYSNFMMALLVCQSERMWTIMPWLYRLQSSSGPGVIFSSLIFAAIPTFLVFVFCQNVIMRGIVVPVEK